MLALRWADVDLDDGRARRPQSTKTKTTREIGISDAAVDVLREHRAQRRPVVARRASTRSPPTRSSSRPAPGAHSRGRNVLRAWQDALAEVGIDDAGLHTLRHSFISRLEERGVRVAIAAELVGHSRITTTQAVYTRMRGGREAKLQAQREALRVATS